MYKYNSTNKDWSFKPDASTSYYLNKVKDEKKAKRKAKRLGKKPSKRSDKFYSSWEWLKVRFEVLKAYGAVCMLCHTTERIVVDHIKPRRKFPELALEFDNLQVLCNRCNQGKNNDDYTDFRPKSPEPELEAPEMQHLRDILAG